MEAFLNGCRETARDKGRFQIASISLQVPHISPLAVLQSIYEPGELHCYMERAAGEEAVAGAEAVVEARFRGAHRYRKAREFADEVFANTIATGDLQPHFAGPHFFAAFTFSDQNEPHAAFAPATLFLPRWQVARSGGAYEAVANVRVDPDSDLKPLVERVWAAYERFRQFDYEATGEAGRVGDAPAGGAVERARDKREAFLENVREALRDIEARRYDKIVLSRSIDLRNPAGWQPLDALNRLRERFPGCFAFSFGSGRERSYIGATPERILSLREKRLETEALAGSAPRGANARDDAALARDLLRSDKDLREHRLVLDSIIRRLQELGIYGRADERPQLLQLANVQHLRSRIAADLGRRAHPLEILEALHPTPAVGGSPRERAAPRIREIEGEDRGLYTGAIGWFNPAGESEMILAIRSAYIAGETARLHAGAGIVRGSDPEAELRETDIKLNAMLEAFDPDREAGPG